MEKDKEFTNTESHYDFGARIYDSRLGKWMAVDPALKEYPDLNPYNFVANNPIMFVDPDGKRVRAYDTESKDLVIKTLNYVFGEGHGFSFESNVLVQAAEPPKNMTSQQTLMYKYFVETLIESQTITTVKVGKNNLLKLDNDGNLQAYKVTEGTAKTFNTTYPRVMEYGEGPFPRIISSERTENDILVTSGLLANGINLNTEAGNKVFNPEHALLHEFAHAIVYTIMNEMGGQFNGTDFNKMNKQERSDWAIRYTNTLIESKGQSIETGAGQHNRDIKDTPDKSKVEPLKK